MRTPVLDDDGRLFGRVNIIDAAAIAIVLLLIPLGYAAYLLFRSPIPTVVAIEPTTVTAAPLSRVTVRGTDLRPFMRAFVGTSAVAFLVESPTTAELRLPQLNPGTYDLALYDEAQELVRIPSALTIVPPVPQRLPTPTILAVEPETVTTAAESRVRVRGTDLRPFMRVLIGSREAGLVVENSTNAEVKLPQLDPGKYDLALYEQNEELVRVPSILTVVASVAPIADIMLTGMFVGLDKSQASKLSTTVWFGRTPRTSVGRIVALGRPEPDVAPVRVASGQINVSVTTGFKIDALIRIRCQIAPDTCSVGGATVVAGQVISIPSEHGILKFRVADVLPADVVPIEITTLCATIPELLALAQKDLAAPVTTSPFEDVRAKLIGLGEAQSEQLQFGLSSQVWFRPGVVFSARFRVPARRTATGWEYDGAPLRAGERFTYSTPTYTLVTMIVDIGQPQTGKTPDSRESQ